MPILTCYPYKPPRKHQLVVQVKFWDTLQNTSNGRVVVRWIDQASGDVYLVTETNNVYKLPNTDEPWGVNCKMITDNEPPPRVQ